MQGRETHYWRAAAYSCAGCALPRALQTRMFTHAASSTGQEQASRLCKGWNTEEAGGGGRVLRAWMAEMSLLFPWRAVGSHRGF